jgi:hypothetical protein
VSQFQWVAGSALNSSVIFEINTHRMSKRSYNEIAEEIKDLPMTWYPALIIIAVEAAIAKGVFVPGGVSEFVRKVEKITPLPPKS